jgi:hypothetical protein
MGPDVQELQRLLDRGRQGKDMITPPSWLMPKYFVDGLRILNGN